MFPKKSAGKTAAVIDHRNSYVHTLANYIRQTGSPVRTVRIGCDKSRFETAFARAISSNYHLDPDDRMNFNANKPFPIAAVQLLPESILSDHDKLGAGLIHRMIPYLSAQDYPESMVALLADSLL